ncbi:hypothetical protein NQ315_006376, partial [Exocentrus adspersus]
FLFSAAMAEIDYQLALLLQHRFEQEAKKPKEHLCDEELAKVLHEQFQTETEIDAPKNGLVYKPASGTSTCLVDPSWEVIDPTPDIHVLFLSFNDRFFWSTLAAVCVSWSKKMTTCAGVCAYHTGGLCSITLSEPLLKLRPRKDLVETLLHEMIHAYLFVTHNNKDRDGHGPEFHKHMYRINKEAGTSISVYHDFHDEVRLYKQHWWRCDGPCQNRKPFFGMVRRAMNRAPGPYDRWWAEHSRTCGGSFIKVKEPDKVDKKTPAKENIKPKEDIRKYFTPTKAGGASTSTAGVNKPLKDNIRTIKTSDNAKVSAVIPKANNIFGFSNMTGSSNASKPRGGGTAVKNNTSTLVINKKPRAATKTSMETKTNLPVKAQVLSETTSNNNTSDYSVVRNHWLNKFPSGGNSVKRPLSVSTGSGSKKVPRLCEDETRADCPVCLDPVPLSELNQHLDNCLEKPKTKDCIICGSQVATAEYETHVTKCSEDNFDDDDIFIVQDVEETKKCTMCQKQMPVAEYDVHAQDCLLNLYSGLEEEYCDKSERVDCLACGKKIVKSELDAHLEEDCMSLSQVFEERSSQVEEPTPTPGRRFNCPFCMVLVPEVEMSVHIDACLSTDSGSAEGELNKSFLKQAILLDEQF